MNDKYILAFETSCDETSVAVLKNGDELLSNVIASQIESHKRFGGVVPEVASRHHVEVITACIEEALAKEVDIITRIPTEYPIFTKYIERDKVLLYESQLERRADPANHRAVL